MEDIIVVNSVCMLNSLFANLTISNDLVNWIKVAQETDKELQWFLTSLNFIKEEDDVIRCDGRLCVPNNEELRSEILRAAHHSIYIHLGAIKMYQDIKRMYCG